MIHEVRLAVRTLSKQPWFVAAALLSLTLGIAANTVIFTFVKAVFLPILPVKDPSSLVLIYSTTRSRTGQVVEYQSTSYLNARDYQSRNNVFAGLAVIVDSVGTFDVGASQSQVPLNLVSADYFEVVGVAPVRGRTISTFDEAPSAAPVIVISYALWKSQLAGDEQALGRSIRFNQHPYTVVGVMPPEFQNVGGLPRADVWIPAIWHDQVLVGNIREWYNLRATRVASMVARLETGVPLRRAQEEMTAIGMQLQQEYPADNAGRNVMLVPLEHTVVSPSQRNLYIRAGIISSTIVGVLLLIACSNVASLLLAHAFRRRGEFSIRAALGASRGAIVRQLLIEGLIVATAAGVIGLIAAYLARAAVAALLPGGLPSNLDFTFDGRVILFTVGISVLATLIFALGPALRASNHLGAIRPDWIAARFSGRRSVHNILVVGQIGLALVALVTAALFIRSLRTAERTDLGFDLGSQVVASVDLAALRYTPPRAREFYDTVTQRLQALPFVESVTVGDTRPLSGSYRRTVFSAAVDTSDPSNGRLAGIINVAPDFFTTVGMQLLRGRDFDGRDDVGSAQVAIVNDTAAMALWPGENPIGKQLRLLLQDSNISVVGVVNTVTYLNVGEAPQPIIYMPLRQHLSRQAVIYTRAAGDPDAVASAVRVLLAEIEPGLASAPIRTGRQILHQSLTARRLGAQLLSAFGGLALLLSMLGTYGIVSYTVGQSRREIGIRMALGATRPDVFLRFVARHLTSAVLGVTAGLCLGALVTSMAATMLYGIGAFDPLSFGGAAALLLAVAFIACAIPVWRATNADSIVTLRAE